MTQERNWVIQVGPQTEVKFFKWRWFPESMRREDQGHMLRGIGFSCC